MITILRFILFFLFAPVFAVLVQAAEAAQHSFSIVDADFRAESVVLDSVDTGIYTYDSVGALLQQRSSIDGKDDSSGYEELEILAEAQSFFSFLAEFVATNKIDNVVDAVEPNRIYSARELVRRSESPRINNAPNPNHNFPESFNSDIFQGNKTIVSDSYHLYTKPGVLNGRSGMYEIGVKPSASGRTEVITHRFFRPNKK